MEEDVDKIVNFEPDEAKKLIWLIELLFVEWYLHRHNREQKLQELSARR